MDNSLRRLFLGLPLLIASNVSLAAAPAKDPAGDFEKFVLAANSEVDGSESVYFDKTISKWFKCYVRLVDLRYDVKKTDSLLTPMWGIVRFLARFSISQPFDSEQEALAGSVTPWLRRPEYRIELNYGFKDGRWSLRNGTSAIEGSVVDRGQELSEARILFGTLDHPVPIMRRWVFSVKPK